MRSKDRIIKTAEARGCDTEEGDGDEEAPPRLPNRGELYDIPKDVPGAPE